MFQSFALIFALFFGILLPFQSSHAVPKFTRSQAYGDWVLNCAKDTDPKVEKSESCSLSQKIVTEKGVRILGVNIVNTPAKKRDQAIFSLPLGFYIPDGVKVSVDKGRTRRLLVAFCTQQAGCVAQIELDKKFSRELASGKKMKVTLHTVDRKKQMDFAVSLKGIAAGLRAIK
ncbi:MAG: invasion associated locus B family protein [Magnetococcales bacterium]|nr:invasion associated locus B family protein [Magnetococcales bacterium]